MADMDSAGDGRLATALLLHHLDGSQVGVDEVCRAAREADRLDALVLATVDLLNRIARAMLSDAGISALSGRVQQLGADEYADRRVRLAAQLVWADALDDDEDVSGVFDDIGPNTAQLVPGLLTVYSPVAPLLAAPSLQATMTNFVAAEAGGGTE